MRTEPEVAYLVKAVDAFRRKRLVISPTFEILAANCPIDGVCDEEVGGYHHALIFPDIFRSLFAAFCNHVFSLLSGQILLVTPAYLPEGPPV